MGDVEGVKSEFLWIGVLRLHNLNHSCPFNLFALLDRLPQITLGVVRILTTHARGFLLSELLLTVLGDEMILDVDELALGIDPLEGVAAIAVFVAPALGGAVITEEHETGMVAFGRVGK
jgi:hypothetical protein